MQPNPIDPLADALVTHLRASQSAVASANYPGATTHWIAPSDGPKTRQTDIVRYPSLLYVVRPNYAVRFYVHPIDGWNVSLEYEPDDDLFPGLIYRSRTAWADDDRLEAAWDRALTTHHRLWGKNGGRPVKTAKAPPRDYLRKDSIYVPMEG